MLNFRLLLLPCPKYWQDTNINDLDGEIWIPIPKYETLYKASSYGRIKSLERPRSKSCNAIRDKIVKQPFRGLYLKVDLSDYRHNKKTISVHRLIAISFHPNPKAKPQVNHKDLIKIHNWALNLEWNTRIENGQHASKAGKCLTNRGEAHSQARLSKLQVLSIFNSTDNYVSIANKYKINRTTVNDIKTGRRWWHVTGLERKKSRRIIEIR